VRPAPRVRAAERPGLAGAEAPVWCGAFAGVGLRFGGRGWSPQPPSDLSEGRCGGHDQQAPPPRAGKACTAQRTRQAGESGRAQESRGQPTRRAPLTRLDRGALVGHRGATEAVPEGTGRSRARGEERTPDRAARNRGAGATAPEAAGPSAEGPECGRERTEADRLRPAAGGTASTQARKGRRRPRPGCSSGRRRAVFLARGQAFQESATAGGRRVHRAGDATARGRTQPRGSRTVRDTAGTRLGGNRPQREGSEFR